MFGRHRLAVMQTMKVDASQSFLPGSHKTSRISSRFVRSLGGKPGTTFEDVDGVEPNEEQWEDMDGWREEPCQPGTLVLIHGQQEPHPTAGGSGVDGIQGA